MSNQALIGEMVFEVQDIDTANLPHGWTFNKNNNSLELKQKLADFWEVKGGCLIRHHVRPRSKKFLPGDQADLPVPLEKLDDVRVTIFREPGQEPSAITDHFKTENVLQRSRQRFTFKVGWTHDLPDQCRDSQGTWNDCNLVLKLSHFREAHPKGRSAHEEPAAPTHQEGEEQVGNQRKEPHPDRTTAVLRGQVQGASQLFRMWRLGVHYFRQG